MLTIRRICAVLAGMLVLLSGATFADTTAHKDNAGDRASTPLTEQDKVLYFMGTQLGESLSLLRLTETELQWVLLGVKDTVSGEPLELDPAVFGPKLNEFGTQRHTVLLEEERPLAKAYLARMADEDGARTTASGLIFLPLQRGTGSAPTSDSLVELNYHATLRDGRVVDSSVVRGHPIQVPLNRVQLCWQEGLLLLKEGGKAKITCPASLTYQDKGPANIPPGAAISYEIELLRVIN